MDSISLALSARRRGGYEVYPQSMGQVMGVVGRKERPSCRFQEQYRRERKMWASEARRPKDLR
ncbi:hypothetical protein M408DRAFT_302455 [Serendipita vermifera MAFF 305830]|uniref:Uncharacterized protein n=1 Tax=Serendipita vermifera MAFF 305830 TaxID=933852 RepID=A0A0C2WWD7_SERVB|nr:hypothetical protein M408DRAFT_302455 [Serendipita vermifera MAFF 305830]